MLLKQDCECVDLLNTINDFSFIFRQQYKNKPESYDRYTQWKGEIFYWSISS